MNDVAKKTQTRFGPKQWALIIAAEAGVLILLMMFFWFR